VEVAMQFKLTEQQQALKKEYDDFFREEMKNAPPVYRYQSLLEAAYTTDEGYAFCKYMQKKLIEKGWYVRHWPKEYGGQDAPLVEQLILNESMAYFGVPGIDGWGVGMFGPTLMLHASDEQKQRLLPPIARGEVQYCQGWSEPNAGSDLASLRTTAIKDGEYYIVNGQKIWITAAHRSDRMFLLARTDPASKRNAGLAVFNVDMGIPGIEVRPIMYMNGVHLYNEIFLTDVKIHESERIGQEGQGWGMTRDTMNFERSGSGAYVGVRRGLENLLAYIKTTKRHGKLLADDPLVRQKLGRLYSEMEAGRALSYQIAWLQEKGNLRFSPAAASESKVFGTELVQRVADFAIEIMGLHGQIEHSPWAPLNGAMVESYQESVAAVIYAGSNEIQRNIIAWVGLGLPRLKGQG
jgi:alkylation response protein AidB-like acyl-CoA dehydrogenase